MRANQAERRRATALAASVFAAGLAMLPLPAAAERSSATSECAPHARVRDGSARAARRARVRAARAARKERAAAARSRGRAEPQRVLAPHDEAAPDDQTDAALDAVVDPEPLEADVAPAAPSAPEPPPEPSPVLRPTLSSDAPRLRATRAIAPPSIDGAIDDAVWSTAAPVDAFTQKAPVDASAPTERTTLRFLYDDEAVYVAFDCHQTHSPILARLARRDRPIEADSVSVAFDSRGDGWSAFEFSVSAAGVLVDGLRFDDGKIAREWDAAWEARTQQREDGWSAELRIPLNVLRFDAASATAWRFQARRYVAARQEIDEWAHIPRAQGGEVSRYGRIEQLEVSGSAGSFEAVPFVLGRATHQSRDPAIAREGTRFGGSAGVDFKWQPSRSFALNGTLNPDFGQVEADRLILNLSTIEVAFPEKRPFFLANMDDFVTLMPIVYSRRIGRTPKLPSLASGEQLEDYAEPSPIYGALKIAADLGSNSSVAAMSALAGPNEVTVFAADGVRHLRLLDPLTSYNVLRVRTKLARGFELGAIGTATLRNEPGFGWPAWITGQGEYLTLGQAGTAQVRCPDGPLAAIDDRCSHDAYVLGADFAWRSAGGDYAVRGQGYGSAIENGPARVFADGTRVESGDLGAGGTLRLSKQGGGAWLLDGTVAAHSAKLDFNDLGFMDRQNYLRGGAYVEYRTLEPWAFLLETHTSALAYAENDWSALPLARGVLLLEHLVFEGRWTLTVGGYTNLARYDDREVGDGTALERAAMLGAVQAVSTDPTQAVVLTAQLAEERMSNGENYSAQVGLTWQPFTTADLSILGNYTFNSGEPRYVGTGGLPNDLVFGRLDAESAGIALRASYTFMPALTLQAYAQTFLARGTYYDYMHVRRDTAARTIVRLNALSSSAPPETSPDFERAMVALNVVLRWEYQFGSTLYLLYVRSQNPNITLQPSELPRLDLGRLRNAPSTDVLMVKLAYWIG